MSIIEVSGLSKQYRIGTKMPYKTLRETLMNAITSPARLFSRNTLNLTPNTLNLKPDADTFWALKDVSFEVQQGEVLGIIGRNGAGKTTLLKILSRVTEPTEGEVKIRGRVGSLLEVGTGFHPELTGRENIFLNGAILGMRREEIKRKFDEIVAFAEIEKFLDTPVKRYSSGMYVRLAFAVAAHLEPEILLVDEVLAVGDAQFQKKCLGKMEDVARGGRTVLFVSHNMAAVSTLCSQAIVLYSGRITFDGSTSKAIGEYMSAVGHVESMDLTNIKDGRRGSQVFAELKWLSIFNKDGQPCRIFGMGDSIIFHLQILFNRPVKTSRFGILFTNYTDILIHDFTSGFDGFPGEMDKGLHTFEIIVPQIMVYPGIYYLGAWIQQDVGIPSDDYIRSALSIEIMDVNKTGHPSAKFGIITKSNTEVYVPCQWRKL